MRDEAIGTSNKPHFNWGPETSAAIALVILFTLCSLFVPRFFMITNFRNILIQISINATVAVGMNFVILSGGIDLSVGSNVAACGMLMGVLMTKMGWSTFPSVLCGLLLTTLAGCLNGVLVSKGRLAPFIATLGTMSILRGFSYLNTKGAPLFDFPDAFLGFASNIARVPLPIIIMVAVVGSAWYILKYTKLGRYTYSIGGNEAASVLSGINVNSYKIAIYSVQGFLCGLASCILTARLDSAVAVAGESYELDAIAAVIIGGTSMNGGQGRVIGTILGVLLMGTLSNAQNLLAIPPGMQRIIKGLIILAAVYVDTLRKNKSSSAA
ncbi:MAG: ribose ABC transporter permease [Synergistaceae bacterium]|nr:ribose ABC transporter permease [Synergistaceae bacterium]